MLIQVLRFSSYLSVTVAAIDGAPHAVQLYADTSAGMLFASLF
jgi:hypothetical protein